VRLGAFNMARKARDQLIVLPERALRLGVDHDPELVIQSVAHRLLLSGPPSSMLQLESQ